MRNSFCNSLLSELGLLIMADPGKAPVEHSLALKVMRLTRPTMGQSTIVQTSGTDLEK